MLIRDLVPVLQLSIGPVILISGVGLLLLSMTNRYGRVIDRARALADLARREQETDSHRRQAQLNILARRARLLRLSIILATLSLLLAALLIIALFLTSLLGVEAAVWVACVFIACMVSLIASLVVFIADLNASLGALDLEIDSEQR